MIEALDHIDRRLFEVLNGLHSPFFDEWMYWVSEKWVWIPLYLLVLYAVWHRLNPRQMLLFALSIGLLVLLTDQLASGLLKPWIGRYRPCRDEADLDFMVHIVRGHCGGAYGFASSHAANFFGLAVFVAQFFRRPWIWATALGLASLTAYSRVYLGVHYPGDVLVGALIGALAGWGIFALYGYALQKTATGASRDGHINAS